MKTHNNYYNCSWSQFLLKKYARKIYIPCSLRPSNMFNNKPGSLSCDCDNKRVSWISSVKFWLINRKFPTQSSQYFTSPSPFPFVLGKPHISVPLVRTCNQSDYFYQPQNKHWIYSDHEHMNQILKVSIFARRCFPSHKYSVKLQELNKLIKFLACSTT